MQVVDLFHRFVRPTKMSEQAINKYIEGKYGDVGVDRVWHHTAIPFKQVVEEFESWLAEHGLWGKETDGTLNDAAFVTWTIINGICYLATFVFGINAVGLLLYSGQLAFNEESDEAMKATTEPGDSSGNNNSSEVNKSSEDQSSGD